MVAAVDLVREQALWVDEQQNPARSRGQFFSARDISKCYFHCQLVIQMSVSKVFIHGVKIIHQTICASVKDCWF